VLALGAWASTGCGAATALDDGWVSVSTSADAATGTALGDETGSGGGSGEVGASNDDAPPPPPSDVCVFGSLSIACDPGETCTPSETVGLSPYVCERRSDWTSRCGEIFCRKPCACADADNSRCACP
jgi:hypothetical protein